MGAVAIFYLLLWLSWPVAAQTWRSIGPPGGDVRALAQDPKNPNQLYLGTTDGHIFGSQDAGEHWSLLGRTGLRSDSVVTSILVDPRDPLRLYASTWTQDPSAGGGVFQSDDGGRAWRPAGLAGQAVRALVQAPSDPDRLVAGTLEGVFGSHDAGRTWQRLSPEANGELRNLDSLAVDPRQPDVVYAGTFHLPWKTSDGGRTWAPVHSGMIDDSDVMSLLIDRANPELVYASACSGIYRSENSAALWQKIQGIPYAARRTHVIAQDPANPQIIYAGTTEGLWKSSDAGAVWHLVTPPDWIINAMVLPLRQSGRVVLGTEELGVIVSDDGGQHFRQANEGFNHRQMAAVAFDSQHNERILAVLAHAPEPILVTDNGGQTWSTLGPGLTMRQLKRIFASPGGWWAALEGGGLMQYDSEHGVWKRVGMVTGAAGVPAAISRPTPRGLPSPIAPPAGKRTSDPAVNDMAFTSKRWFAATERGLLFSDDRGARWQLMPLGPLLTLPVDSVRVSIDAQSLWVVSQRGLVFSTDGGRTWVWHDLPLSSGGALRLELAPSPLEPEGRTLVALAHNGLYISRNGGDTWQQAGSGLPQLPVEGFAVVNDLFVATLHVGGLFLSRDSGRTWDRVTGTVAEGLFPAVAAEGRSVTILAASATDGLYAIAFAPAGSATASPTSDP